MISCINVSINLCTEARRIHISEETKEVLDEHKIFCTTLRGHVKIKVRSVISQLLFLPFFELNLSIVLVLLGKR